MCLPFTVGDNKVSEIGRGLCILLGISRDDTLQELEYMWVFIVLQRFSSEQECKYISLKQCFCSRTKKILSLKLFDGDNDKKWAKNVVDKDFEVLCVSQVIMRNAFTYDSF